MHRCGQDCLPAAMLAGGGACRSVSLSGKLQEAGWVPRGVRLITRDERKSYEVTNVTSLGIITAFPRATRDRIGHYFEPYGEFLPMLSADGEYYLYNVTNVIDCLDLERCSYETFDDGRIMRIEKYMFRKECLENQDVFRIRQTHRSRDYITSRLVKKIEALGITGFRFDLLWCE